MNQSWRISRRRLLRGLGTAVALPALDVMSKGTALAASNAKPPLRLGFFYVPNGVRMDDWRPTNQDLTDLPKVLRPLAPVKDQVLVISDLEAAHCTGKGAGHEPAGGGFLVGKKCKHSEEPEVGGISVDQVAARELGLRTAVDSLALGIDPGHRGDHGYSGTYLSHISWRSRTMPAALEINPKQVFDRLFRGREPQHPSWDSQRETSSTNAPRTVEQSVLDAIAEDTRSLQRQLGFEDRRKLEAYLDGLRSVERRVQAASNDAYSHHQDAFEAGVKDIIKKPDGFSELCEVAIPDGRGIPKQYEDHVELMLDVLTLAFQTDATRVASFMFSYEKSGRNYSSIGAKGSHHSLSHHENTEEKLSALTKINTLHMQLFAGMLEKMRDIREGDSMLLDNTLFLYGSGISDGNKHNHDDLPILMAGGGGGTIRGGRHLKLGEKTPICNAYLDMLDRAGIHRKQFGDSTGRLNGLA